MLTEAERKYQREYKAKLRADPVKNARLKANKKRSRQRDPEHTKMMDRLSYLRIIETRRAYMARQRRERPDYVIWKSAKYRARALGVPFAIAPEDIVIPKLCPVLGIPIRPGGGRGYDYHSPSVDRIIPALGYVPGNIRVISHKANQIKNVATPEELMLVAQWAARETARVRDELAA